MKNKWTKVVALILVGLILMGAAGAIKGSVVGSLINIVGFILLVVGIIEAFKKEKRPPTVA